MNKYKSLVFRELKLSSKHYAFNSEKLREERGIMKGYLYKELKQNRFFLSLAGLLAVSVAFLPIIIVMTEEKTMAKEAFLVFAQGGTGFRILCALAAVAVMLIIQTFILKGDDKKLWGYFVASNPKGIKGFVFTKYGFILAVNVVYLVLCSLSDLVFTFIANYIAGISVPLMAGVYITLFFFQLLLCAVDIPFTIRFGDKKGSSVKTIIMIVLLIILILVWFLNPVAVADIMNNFLLSGEMPPVMNWLLPALSVASLRV